MKLSQNNKHIFRLFLLCLCFILLLFLNIFKPNPVIALEPTGNEFYVMVWDKYLQSLQEKSIIENAKNWAKSITTQEFWLKTLPELGSQALNRAIQEATKKIAYDLATWLGSGGRGQQPLFVTEGWGEYLTNITDEAAGTFIEQISKKWNANLCQPDIMLKVKIGLGLTQYVRPVKPTCTFSEMVKNWDQELSRGDFLTRFQDMFNPASSDLGIALSLQTGMIQEQNLMTNNKTLERLANRGWLDLKGPSDRAESPPGTAESRTQVIQKTLYDKLGQYTGNALTDAANVFLNQLFITLFNNMMEKLGQGLSTYTSPYRGDYGGLTQYAAAPVGGGIAGAKERLRQLVEPNFTIRGDYNILAELSTCNDPNKAGPTNCVIENKFRQAIESKLTVGEALKQGYLNANGVFGFNSDGLEPRFNEGYPYRSMIILRKFRIIPVGWEVAAQFIKDHPGSIDGTKNLADLVNCFSSDDDYQGYSASWCQGLVDPSWVLKAPLNFCKREGSGPEIMSEQVMGSGYDSQLMVTRNDKYCADEQSCIQENNDGTCKLYGYCTEDRRKWNFNGQSCEPRNNTCETFRGPDGQTISYLENTLDYGSCNINNAGCQAYCLDYNYSAGNFSCTSSTGNKIYLNRNAESCDQPAEGCHEFIRLKAGTGANLLTNSSFEDDITGTIWQGAGTIANEGYDGSKALQLSASLTKTIAVASADYSVRGEVFSLSFYAKNCGMSDNFQITGQAQATSLAQGSDWQQYQTTYIFPTTASGNQVGFTINSSSCLIDAIKLERGELASAYNNYGGRGLIYEKLAPGYLNCNGVNDPAECANFVRSCGVNEVGCDLYTSANDNIGVAAKVLAQDYCPAECIGYDTYIQSQTTFDSLRDAYFIPKTAKTCNASGVGCDQFTNLDEVARGGEGIEYYSYLRQCIKPSTTDCSDFYTWEGSDESGFQLRVNGFKVNQANGEPEVTENDSLDCNETIYSLAATSPSYNTDCQQFYSRTGQLSYHLFSRTISCDNDCHPYRRTALNIDPTVSSSAECSGSDKHWDSANSQCVLCKNQGVWDDQHQACLYMAIPGRGISCSASDNGCRQYSGNISNNSLFILNNDFEGSLQGWTGLAGTNLSLSNDSLVVGGNSLRVSGGSYTARAIVGQTVATGKSYVLTFLAKAQTATKLSSIRLANSSSESSEFSSVNLTNKWRSYNVSLASLNHNVDDQESLIITADGDYLLDDVKLTEVIDRYFLIKDSWTTPESCDRDIEGNPSPLYMLGCQAYHDRDNKTHNLHNFSFLCQDSAVGCELMIDTHNSTNYQAETFNLGATSTTVAADSFTYVVYDKDKQCNKNDKGCDLLGAPYQYSDSVLYSPTYVKNDADKYNKILCRSDEVGCQEWTTSEATAYFKDPGQMSCDWRQGQGLASQAWGWYKQKIKRCGGDGGTICLTDKDCLAPLTCKLETSDNPCDTSAWKTFGYGGDGNRVYQPTNGWAGLCAASEAGCSEYLDPVSRFSSNSIFNSDLKQNVDNNAVPDGWDQAGSEYQQDVQIDSYTLYRLAHSNGAANLTINCNYNLFLLNNNNYLSGTSTSLSLAAVGANQENSLSFYSANNTSCTITIPAISGYDGSGNYGETELKKTVIDYQLGKELDKTSCNGVVDFEQGCVLFNERKQNGSALAGLSWDADLTINDGNGMAPQSGNPVGQDTNVLLKVVPDRVCNKWLACRSYIKDDQGNNVCFDIGLCDSVDNNGYCNSFVITKQVNQIYPDPFDLAKINNATGYNKAGYLAGNSLNSDYYSFGAMKQYGEVANLANGGFEYAGSNGYPVGWYWPGGTWQASVFKVIDNPIEAQDEGVGYAPEGNNFLKLGSTYSATSEFTDVVGSNQPGGIAYVLTAYINTINLKTGSARVSVEGFDSLGNSLGNLTLTPEVVLLGGNDWTFKLGRFNVTNQNITRVKIALYSDSSTQGNFYFDDVKLRPALNSKDNWYTPQTCRLYPQADSLSCDYYDSSGKREKGMFGYCLEYDRYPGSSDACLLWWPVDKVKGEGIEEGAGYRDKFPLYYCLEATGYCDGSVPKSYCSKVVQTVTATGQNKYWSGRVYEGTNYEVPFATSASGKFINWGAINNGQENVILNYARTDQPFGSMVPPYPVVNPYEWDGLPNQGNNLNNEPLLVYPPAQRQDAQTHAGTPYYGSNVGCTTTGAQMHGQCEQACGCTNGSFATCDSGSCGIWDLGVWDSCWITSQESGGGTINIYQNPADNKWYLFILDGCGNTPSDSANYQCSSSLTYNIASSLTEASDGVKRLFAQSYGAWQWVGVDQNNGHYNVVGGLDWSPPTTICPGNSRPAYPNDWCAIPPRITNVKANNSTNNVELAKNQFVNLTFNSNVDEQQLPITMYAIDWGDGESTIVSGVEMRNRTDVNNPHSLYHLFSYWDLKAKVTSGTSGISCVAAGGVINGYSCPSGNNCCGITPRVKIKDNWGWCNSGSTMNDCSQWENFPAWVIVKEK